MSCKKMLVCCGDTYTYRLWCVWELFTLFSFQSFKKAFSKIEVLALDVPGSPKASESAPLGQLSAATDTGEARGLAVLSSLQEFELESAHTYDPNEEKKVRTTSFKPRCSLSSILNSSLHFLPSPPSLDLGSGACGGRGEIR